MNCFSNSRGIKAIIVLAFVSGLCGPIFVLSGFVFGAQPLMVRLHSRVAVEETVVRLADVGDIDGVADRLANLVVAPAPPVGQYRYISASDIRQVLAAVAGAANVQIVPAQGGVFVERRVVLPGQNERSSSKAGSISTAGIPGGIEQTIENAIIAYLKHTVGEDTFWRVRLIKASAEVPIEDNLSIQAIVGGSFPWIGRQQFKLLVQHSNGEQWLEIEAVVARVTPVVIARHDLLAGMIVGPNDVELASPPESVPRDSIRIIDEVIGAELLRPIAKGKIITSRDVRKPLLVRRGDVVTVWARSGGVRVRMAAKAKADGARGEIIPVETPFSKDVILARVIGYKEVETFVHGTQARETSLSEKSSSSDRLAALPHTAEQ